MSPRWFITPWLLPTRPLMGNQLRVAQLISVFLAMAFTAMFLIALPARFAWLEQLGSQAQTVMWLNTALHLDHIEGIGEVFPRLAIGFEIAVMLLYLLNSALLFWKRSHDWLALLTAAALPGFAVHIIPTMLTWMNLSPTHMLVGSIFKGFGIGLTFLFLYLFPSGSYTPKWIRLFLWAWLVWALIWLAYPNSIFSFYDPYSISLPGFFLLMAWWGVAIFSQIYRYYVVSTPLERQQTKIITLGATWTFIAYAIYVPLRQAMLLTDRPIAATIVFQVVAPYLYLLLIGSIPVLITLSILRYKLWDIDIIIRRTMAYSLISGVLGLLYFASIAFLENILTARQEKIVLESGQPPAVIVVLTTLAIASLFNPLRRRVQSFIDKRFYRSKYNSEQVLADFAEIARSETDLQTLSDTLIAVIQETMQPKTAELWFAFKQETKVDDNQIRSL
jgi:hypothetical protein